MDTNTMSQVGMSGGVVSILTIAVAVFKYLNHRNIRSHCCGRQVDLGIDVDTPPVVIAVPPVPPSTPKPSRRASVVKIEEGLVAVH
jgi:hypothetical protein